MKKKKKNKKLLKKQKKLLKKDEIWGLVAAGSAMLAGMAIRSLLNRSWKAIIKKDPPLDPGARDTSWKEALAWTIASSVAVGVAQVIARRGAETIWEQTVGESPVKENKTLA